MPGNYYTGAGGGELFTTQSTLIGYETEYLNVRNRKKYACASQEIAQANVEYWAKQGVTVTIETRQVPIVHCEDGFF